MLDELIEEVEQSMAGSTVSPRPGVYAGADKKPAQKKEKNKGNREATPAPIIEELNIAHLDLRVGVIVDVAKHETADKLYCEKIDVGEPEPRNIASGLVPHYTLEEMQGRRLIVVANLKPRNLVGFKSSGMVLCAQKTLEDGSEKVYQLLFQLTPFARSISAPRKRLLLILAFVLLLTSIFSSPFFFYLFFASPKYL
jgi:aminoacyl tRNA synthase complex-interacting multifunctional protein 1